MVFVRICEHASSAFIFANKSSDRIYLVGSELFRKYLMMSSEHFVTHTGGQIKHATNNNFTQIAKTCSPPFISAPLVSISKLSLLNPRQLFFFSLGLI